MRRYISFKSSPALNKGKDNMITRNDIAQALSVAMRYEKSLKVNGEDRAVRESYDKALRRASKLAALYVKQN